jgi:CheY-like chemotaxis protein
MIDAIIVDDESHNIEWIADYIRHFKGKVEIASNEADACKFLLYNKNCNLLIVDIRIGRTIQTTESMTLKDANPDWGGLFVANYARVTLQKKERDLKILAYTVVKEEDLLIRLKSLQVLYFRKGDIKELRDYIKKMS